MRQIIICIFMVVFASNAAPLNRRVVAHELNRLMPVVGNLHGYTIEETMETLFNLSNKKINFLYFPHLGPKPPDPVNANPFVAPQFGGIDPTTGLPFQPMQPLVPAPQVARQGEPKIVVAIGELKNVTLKQVLSVVVMSMQPPVRYVIMDYGVVFIPRGRDKPFMPVWKFNLNLNHFRK